MSTTYNFKTDKSALKTILSSSYSLGASPFRRLGASLGKINRRINQIYIIYNYYIL